MLALPMRAFIATCAIAVCVSPAMAQDPPPLQSNVFFHVKPDHVAEFRAIQARYTDAAKERGIAYRGVWRNRNNRSEYVILTPRESFAALNRTRTPSAEGASLSSRMSRTYDDRDVVVVRPLAELGSPSTSPVKMVVVYRTTVKPGMAARYMEWIKVRNDARKKLGETGFGVSRVALGGSITSFMSWTAIDSLADLDTPGTFTARWRESAGDAVVDK